MQRSRGLTLEEIAKILEEEDDDVSAIYIEPPEASTYSDEDSADEDSGGLIDNLSGRQLRAGAETVFTDGRRIGGCDSDDDDDDHGGQGDGASNTSSPAGDAGVSAKLPLTSKWKKGDLQKSPAIFPDPNFSSYRDFFAVELFELFFDEAVVELLVEQTRKYALFLNMPDPEVTTEEMRCFIGVLVLSGYTRLPGKKCYWDSGTDMRNAVVYNAMRRNRFIQIMRFLHCADNASLTLSDKLTKLRPLMTLLKARFLKHFQPVRHLSYDESMIEYYGRHGCKQFIRGKPIRFGYKVWCPNAKNGYLVNFEVYQGKQGNPGRSAKYEKDFGKAAAPLLQMVNELPSEAHHFPFFFYFDNLFTSIPLLMHLKGQGYEGGTVRQNRVPKECPIARPDFVKRQPRGHEEHVLSDDGIIVFRWMDNSVVTIASTIHGVEPVSSADRYSRAQKKRIKVPRPNTFAQYNSFMGGSLKLKRCLQVEAGDPLLANKTLPKGMSICRSTIKGAQYGVLALKPHPRRVYFGPYEGFKVEDNVEDNGYTWQ
ncbi:hypothetical protein V5799_022738, partial [Amblyomma americanum]